MAFFRILVLSIIFVAALIVFSLGVKDAPMDEPQLSFEASTSDTSVSLQTQAPLSNPLVWRAPEELAQQEEHIVSSGPSLDPVADSPPPVSAPTFFDLLLEQFSREGSELSIPSSQPTSPQSVSTMSAEEFGNYLALLPDVFGEVGFAQDDFSSLKMHDYGRPYVLEELLDELVRGGDINALRPSLAAWRQFDAHTLASLQSLSISNEAEAFHQTVLDWYAYRISVADRLLNEQFSLAQLQSLQREFQQRAVTDAPNLRGEGLSSNSFHFISRAHAFLGFYPFGGEVKAIKKVCATGMLVEIGPPRGGDLWLYLPILAINPYDYGLMQPKVNVVGQALWGPGICYIPPFEVSLEGKAWILFWGSSRS